MAINHPLAVRLLRQASGSAIAEAAVLLLSEALGGRLLDAVTLAWDDDDRAMAAIDWETTRSTTGYLSGGERRLLALADSLGSGHPVDLADTLTGLDPWTAQAVVTAIAQATGAEPERLNR